MSSVAVIGGTGRTGRLIVEGALHAGHDVTAVARHPERLAGLDATWSRSGRLHVTRGDVTDPPSLTAALDGTDVAVGAVSAGTRHPGAFMTDSTRVIITALDAAHVGRYIAVSSIGAATGDTHPPWWYRRIVAPLLLRDVYTDLRTMETLVRAMPDRAWTIVRASRLTDAAAPRHLPRRGRPRPRRRLADLPSRPRRLRRRAPRRPSMDPPHAQHRLLSRVPGTSKASRHEPPSCCSLAVAASRSSSRCTSPSDSGPPAFRVGALAAELDRDPMLRPVMAEAFRTWQTPLTKALDRPSEAVPFARMSTCSGSLYAPSSFWPISTSPAPPTPSSCAPTPRPPRAEAEQIRDLDLVDTAWAAWYADTAVSRDRHDRSRYEQRSRRVDDPPDRTSATDWQTAPCRAGRRGPLGHARLRDQRICWCASWATRSSPW